jgi:hypothetical protein
MFDSSRAQSPGRTRSASFRQPHLIPQRRPRHNSHTPAPPRLLFAGPAATLDIAAPQCARGGPSITVIPAPLRSLRFLLSPSARTRQPYCRLPPPGLGARSVARLASPPRSVARLASPPRRPAVPAPGGGTLRPRRDPSAATLVPRSPPAERPARPAPKSESGGRGPQGALRRKAARPPM